MLMSAPNLMKKLQSTLILILILIVALRHIRMTSAKHHAVLKEVSNKGYEDP